MKIPEMLDKTTFVHSIQKLSRLDKSGHRNLDLPGLPADWAIVFIIWLDNFKSKDN